MWEAYFSMYIFTHTYTVYKSCLHPSYLLYLYAGQWRLALLSCRSLFLENDVSRLSRTRPTEVSSVTGVLNFCQNEKRACCDDDAVRSHRSMPLCSVSQWALRLCWISLECSARAGINACVVSSCKQTPGKCVRGAWRGTDESSCSPVDHSSTILSMKDSAVNRCCVPSPSLSFTSPLSVTSTLPSHFFSSVLLLQSVLAPPHSSPHLTRLYPIEVSRGYGCPKCFHHMSRDVSARCGVLSLVTTLVQLNLTHSRCARP